MSAAATTIADHDGPLVNASDLQSDLKSYHDVDVNARPVHQEAGPLKQVERRNRIYEYKHKAKRNNAMAEFREAVDAIIGPVKMGRRRAELEYIKLATWIIK
jgi:hypothetical protein